MSEVKALIDNTRLPAKQRALRLHENIQLHAHEAAYHLVEMCKELKQMRDEKLYESLDYHTFEEYTETALGFKQRQAYSYISALENLGEQVLVEKADWGITKLTLLASATSSEREELMETVDVGEASFRDLKEALEMLRKKTEQLDLFEEENAKLKAQIDESKKRGVEYETSEDALARLEEQQAEIAEAKRKAAEEAAEAARAEVAAELDKLAAEKEKADTDRKEAEKRAKDAEKKIAEAEKEKKAVAAEKDKLAKELEKEKKQVKVDPEMQAALEAEKAKREQLEKQLKVSSDPEMTKFSYLLESLKAQAEMVLAYMAEVAQKHHVDDDANICKMRKATAALLDAIKAKV